MGSSYSSATKRCGFRVQGTHKTPKGSSEAEELGLQRTQGVHARTGQGHHSRSRTRSSSCGGRVPRSLQVRQEEGTFHRLRGTLHWPVHLRWKESSFDYRKCLAYR